MECTVEGVCEAEVPLRVLYGGVGSFFVLVEGVNMGCSMGVGSRNLFVWQEERSTIARGCWMF